MATVRLVFFSIYLASGFAALLYQVVWQRMLAIFSGADLYATTMIVAAFMAGMGIGSLLGGSLADRLSPRGQIAMFALTEFVIGVFGLISKWWYYDVLYVRHAYLANSPIILAAVLFVSLLIPTCCMGMSFPLISKALTPAVELAGRRIGSLYAINTLGAGFGAFATAWFLMGDQDFPRILRLGARINIAAAVLALIVGFVLLKRLGGVSFAIGRETDEDPLAGERRIFSFSTWMLIYALSGFLALSLEILWFRLLGVMLKSNSFTFPHLLAIYLVCLAAGIMIGSRLVDFGKRPEQICLALQSGIIIYAGLSIAALLWAVDNWAALHWLQTYLAGYEPFDVTPARRAIRGWLSSRDFLRSITGSQPNFLTLYIGVPLLLIAPPTLLMGASFPFLQRAVQSTRSHLGRRVGWLQAANIFGATLGAILIGSVFLHFFGTSWTLRLLLALGGTFLILRASLFLRLSVRRFAYAAASAITILLMWSIPPGSELWATLHGAPEQHTISAEDGSGVSLMKNDRADFSSTTLVYVNGLGQSWVPFTVINSIHSELGILPILLHPSPREVAVIGLGSGDTAFSLGGRPETVSITCIEIIAPQLETLRLLNERQPYGGLQSLLNDSRFRFVFTDGRTFIGNNAKKYDIIEADALRPNSAFAGNLYSYEYFMLLKNRLNPGGMAVTWAPTTRVVETFMKVFPYAYRFNGVLIGSADPIDFDRHAIRARLANPFTQAYYAKAGINVNDLVLKYLDRESAQLHVDPRWFAMYDINTDLHPKDEYGR